ncbi:hypothetical protein BJ741DRAFT_598572 [Chytriomyces cf. hyalinus JEL632]|nr:hypothetical protein BJ741DRAFT_598572 [Chytriomyces cf. hyalinus JEL632]
MTDFSFAAELICGYLILPLIILTARHPAPEGYDRISQNFETRSERTLECVRRLWVFIGFAFFPLLTNGFHKPQLALIGNHRTDIDRESKLLAL